MQITNPKNAVALVLAGMMVWMGCSSHRVEQGGGGALDSAVDFYIAGEYERSIEILLDITSKSEGDLETAYLYLGRAYMALGDYVGAADAFSSGKMLGGGIEFDRYLAEAQQHLRTTPRIIGTQESLTRAQLAAVINNVFGDRLGEASKSDPLPPDVAQHWAEPYVARLQAVGVMEPLADGLFYPDAVVTYPAFYVVIRRLSDTASLQERTLETHFPAGWRGTIDLHDGQQVALTGRHATDILRSLLEASERDE